MGPPDGGRPIPIRKITNWKECSYQPRQDSGRGERAGGSGILGSPEVSADILELIRAKTQLCAARAYPTPEYRSRARALQREVKARVREFRNESWSDLMEEIKPSHKAFWAEAEVIGIHKPGNHATSCQLQTDQPPERSGQTIRKILKTRLSDHLLGKGLIIDEQFGFRPAHSCPQQVLRLVEYVSEGFETERSTVAVFFDVAKAFDRQTDISHLGMSALTRQDVLSEQEFLKAPPSLLCCTPRTQTMYRDRRRLASNSRYSRTIPRSFTEIGIGAPDSPSSPSRGPLTS
ncbi:Probable RNA-directed DNA polymerase from transposon BS [Eumeta japonica]|uniref:Probable RNA-directed DNA polymerase from transposon BS n=1 Tax=Eumeta variegata TaxID=151549 RepID=A0A4C1ZI92_EUMVA|nr:Probable RNA-directed DNA polymerase from transposon BS [Eumeta japonica]